MPYFTLSGISPSLLFAITHFFCDWPGTCLLHSGGHLDAAQNSFLGLFPFETITVEQQKIIHKKGKKSEVFCVPNPWDGLEKHFFRPLAQDPDAVAFGWFGYGMGAYADLDRLLPYRSSAEPDAYWQRCAIQLVINWQNKQVSIRSEELTIELIQPEAKEWATRLSTQEGWQDFIKELPYPSVIAEKVGVNLSFLDPTIRKSIYLHKIKQAQEAIRAGENLSSEPFPKF